MKKETRCLSSYTALNMKNCKLEFRVLQLGGFQESGN